MLVFMGIEKSHAAVQLITRFSGLDITGAGPMQLDNVRVSITAKNIVDFIMDVFNVYCSQYLLDNG